MKRWSLTARVAIVGLLAVAILLLGRALHPLAVDDAYITYRFAHNLAAGNGFVYNPGRPVLSTTAPLYALLLSLGAWLGFDLPALANVLSALAVGTGAVLMLNLGLQGKTPCTGALAALLYAVQPLLWLSLGLEAAFFLALGLGAIAAYRSGRLYWTAALLGLATLTRGDGVILSVILGSRYAWDCYVWRADRKASDVPRSVRCPRSAPARRALGAMAVYLAVVLPMAGWLTWQFGSPLPATLGAKVAQSELGVTGFYAHTTYLQGLGILVRARLAQSWLYLLFLPALLVGLAALRRQGAWVGLVAGWGMAHLLGYTILGVTPYYWYYAPLVPGLVCCSALGVVASIRWLADRPRLSRTAARGLGGLWAAGLLAAFAMSDWAMVQTLDGPVPPPEDLVSKVLPEAKVGPYEQAGRWLRDHTEANDVVGVTEVGIMGYYAERPMIDFLGLLEPEVAEALARGDLYWALLRTQPEYLALTAVSPLYAYDLRADPWFQLAYVPVQGFDDPRFWGSPVTVYKRQVPRSPLVESEGSGLPEELGELGVDFGDQIRLLGAVATEGDVQPAEVLGLTLHWEALGSVEQDYTVFVHLLGQHERVIAQRDAAPGLGAQPTSQWKPGQRVADPYLLALPEAAYAPDEAVWEVGLYDGVTGQRLHTADGDDKVRFGAVSVVPAGEPLHLSFGPVTLVGYTLNRLSLFPGEPLSVTLKWEGEAPVEVSVQLLSEAGDLATHVDGVLEQEVYSLTLGADDLPGAYDLEVRVADGVTGQPLPLLGTDLQPRSDVAWLTKVRLYPP